MCCNEPGSQCSSRSLIIGTVPLGGLVARQKRIYGDGGSRFDIPDGSPYFERSAKGARLLLEHVIVVVLVGRGTGLCRITGDALAEGLPGASAADSAGVSHRILTEVSAEDWGFEALSCLALHVAQRVEQAVALASWYGLESGEEGRRSEVSRNVKSRGGVGSALLAKLRARGRLMAAGKA